MITTANLTIQFGAKPLFENVSVRFGEGHRYGLIGANGCGKSTLMKILGGDLEATSGNVTIDANERVGKLRQDQFAFEEFTVIDTVIMGHTELWTIKQERDRIYSLPEMGWGDHAGLGEQLALRLGRSVDIIALNDGGVNTARASLARRRDPLVGKRVVIWQFAARDLAVSNGDWQFIKIAGPQEE